MLDPDLAAFLESQPEIRDLSLRGIPAYTSNPFTLPPFALPHLESFRSIHVDPDTEVRAPSARACPHHFSVGLIGFALR
jgi:hypothetical protein